jgi:hypothetical protein
MAEELWAKIQDMSYRDDWVTTGKGTFYEGSPPHGALLSTYLNPEAAKAMTSKPGQMAEDAIIIKENFMPDKTLAALTVMYKKLGYDPEHGDWFWAKFGTHGEIQAAGKPVGCVMCHGAVRSNDYVFTFPIAPIPAFAVMPTDEDTAMAERIWQQLQDKGYRQNWATVPGKGTLYKGSPPHGALLSTYLNPGAEEVMKSKSGQMPDGAVIIKENFMPDRTLAALTVMYKEAGYDPEHGDWFWTKFAADGKIQATGKAKGCIACHGAVRSNDFIFTFPTVSVQP